MTKTLNSNFGAVTHLLDTITIVDKKLWREGLHNMIDWLCDLSELKKPSEKLLFLCKECSIKAIEDILNVGKFGIAKGIVIKQSDFMVVLNDELIIFAKDNQLVAYADTTGHLIDDIAKALGL